LKFVGSGANPTLPQMCLAEYLATGAYERHLRKVRRFYFEQMQQMSRAISEHFPEGTKVTRPQGGLALWLELPPRTNSLALYDRAMKERISIAPGPMFSPTQKFKSFIRLNCGNVWSGEIESAVQKLGKLAKALG